MGCFKASMSDTRTEVQNFLKFLGQKIETHLKGSIFSPLPHGRSGSTYFEQQIIKPYLLKNIDTLIEEYNKNTTFTIKEILGLTESNNEAANRLWYDIMVIAISDDGSLVEAPINIKVTDTNSVTSDNIGGWAILGWCLYGNANATSETALFSKIISGEPFQTNGNDYYIWTFYKDKNRPSPEAPTLFSVLDIEPTAFTFNRSQSFPVQINARKLMNSAHSDSMSYASRQQALVRWLLIKIISAYKNKLDKAESALTAFEILADDTEQNHHPTI